MILVLTKNNDANKSCVMTVVILLMLTRTTMLMIMLMLLMLKMMMMGPTLQSVDLLVKP